MSDDLHRSYRFWWAPKKQYIKEERTIKLENVQSLLRADKNDPKSVSFKFNEGVVLRNNYYNYVIYLLNHMYTIKRLW